MTRKEALLKYAVVVDFDCMADENYSLRQAREWFDSDEAAESYGEDIAQAREIAEQVYQSRGGK